MIPLLALLASIHAAAAQDCYGGHVGDPVHDALMQTENFGTDWAVQLSERAVEDLVIGALASDSARPFLAIDDGGALAALDVYYRYTVDGADVRLEGGKLHLDLELGGWTEIVGIACAPAGAVQVMATPAIAEVSGEQLLVLLDPDVELPDLCSNLPLGSLYATTIADVLEPELELLLAQVTAPVPEVVPFGDIVPGLVDPLSDVEIRVVDAPLDGGAPFLMLGGPLVVTPSCATADYPLFDPAAFHDFDGRLGDGDVNLAISARVVPLIVEYARPELQRSVVVSQSIATARYNDATVWWNGLWDPGSPCACVTGDHERWFNEDQTDPSVQFRLFFDVYFPDIFFWTPGPLTLQLNGNAWPAVSKDGPGLYLDFTKADVYGPVWADAGAAAVDAIGPDPQSAQTYDDAIAQNPIPLDLVSDLDVGDVLPISVTLCRPMANLASFGFAGRYTWWPGDRATLCGGSDTDGDGAWDTWEADADGDGLLDLDELLTDPLVVDSDADGLSDGLEAELGCDGSVADTDGDGAADWIEVVRMGTDCLAADTDGDGAEDGCEDELALDPHAEDSDGDGTSDGDEDLVLLQCP